MEKKERAALLSVGANAGMVILKIATGLYTGAMSVLSEGIHSSVDLFSAMGQFFAIKKSKAPPDKEHDYGHGKFENVSAGTESILIIMAGIMIALHAVESIKNNREPETITLGVIVMVISVILNFLVSSYLMKVAEETSSQALRADAVHLRADIWTGMGVLLGLGLIKLTGLMWLDSVISLGVAFVIIHAGASLAKSAFLELTDASLPSEEEDKIGEVIRSIPEVRGLHALRTRRSGDVKMLDVHVLFEGALPLSRIHAICDELEEKIRRIGFGKMDILIHPEPYGHIEEK
ncbi:MAG: cation transporter [Selenomonadaceae bacterium]|nr:cation transporter [Selenomonadaceae bacterium]